MVDFRNLKQWSNNGLAANNERTQYFQNILNSPEEFLNNRMNSYQESSMFKNKYNKGMNTMLNAQSAQGTSGSSLSMSDLMRMSNSMSNEDMQQYLDNVGNVEKAGLDISGQVDQLGNQSDVNMGQMQLQQAGLDEQKRQYDDQNSWGNFFKKALMGGASGLMGTAFGGASGGLQSMIGSMNGMQNTDFGRNYNNNQFLNDLFGNKNNRNKLVQNTIQNPTGLGYMFGGGNTQGMGNIFGGGSNSFTQK